jgi:hypothetical protein
MSIDPKTLPLTVEYFDTPADFLKYYRAWVIYDEAGGKLNEWEAGFIDGITSNPPRSFSEKQADKVDQIFERYELL